MGRLFVLIAWLGWGCGRTGPWDLPYEGGPDGPDAGDAGKVRPDAGPDAGEVDAGPDAGPFDSGPDGGDFDAGGECLDDSDCDDGRWCDGSERCLGGRCAAGVPVACSDGLTCTEDRCDEATDSCVSTPDDGECDDGRWCNGAETCQLRRGCVDGADPVCNDGVACTRDSCDEAGDRCAYAPQNALCDDGLWCTGTETCNAALGCVDGADPNCDDAIACTDDSCDEAANRCAHAAVAARCDDGLWCTGTEVCDLARGCTDGADPDCDDAIDCTVDACNEAADACTAIPDDLACDDGRFCNGEEICDPGTGCEAGVAVDCDDSVDCTIDFCINFFASCINFPLDFLCGAGMTCDADLGCT